MPPDPIELTQSLQSRQLKELLVETCKIFFYEHIAQKSL